MRDTRIACQRQLTLQAAVDRLRDTGGTVCLHAGVYLLAEPLRVAGAPP